MVTRNFFSHGRNLAPGTPIASRFSAQTPLSVVVVAIAFWVSCSPHSGDLAIAQVSPPSADAARYLDEARAALVRRDAQAAIRAYNSAVEADPTNAEVRFARGYFMHGAIKAAADETSRQTARNIARTDYQYIIANAPESVLAGLARDALALLDGTEALPEVAYTCPEAARREHAEGYRFFMVKQYSEARTRYQKAVELCPENGTFWIHYGDVYFALGDYKQAKTVFIEGLNREPWNRTGHRFVSDAELRLGNVEAAYHRAVLAVLSDPTYEAGWAFLKDITTRLNGEWNRVPNLRPSVSIDRDGQPRVVLPFDHKKLPEGEGFFWVGVGFAEVSELRGYLQEPATADSENKPHVPDRNISSPRLNRERRIMGRALDFAGGEIAKDPVKNSKAFRFFANAQKDGYLDEAIFINLLNKELAPEYVTYREKNRDRLVRYVETMLAPITRAAAPPR